ncbi:unnamed protein product [Caenorhabditis bovis]|uniref:Conserved oligomeric Golgi complex subunit 1 n=1 Tax=Caenorhabditis bovis TaxID=2654633 RepID=A0A8S1EXH7_9PELO|nr:unnamed protein product [Caenorhabditis bovis]
MDVDRLMKDLTVEQLENIQQNLEKEMEGKRESLREMVGRRYRDVLEASSEVRHVCALAEKLANYIANTRISYQTSHIRTGSRDEQRAGEHFFAVNYLLSNIGSDDGEPLDDAIGLCLVEHFQKQLISNHSSPMISRIAKAFTQRIVATRSELESYNIDSLCDISRSDWATNQLAAIAILQTKDISQLLDLYLEKRFAYIGQLIDDSATILTIVDEMKKTLSVVEELFVHGELQHAIQSVCNGQYRSELIRDMCADQAFSFEKTINEEVEKFWRQLREKCCGRGSSNAIGLQVIGDKCAEWIEKTCAMTHRVVAEVCEYFDDLDEIVELLQAITNSLKQDWPRIGPAKNVYDKLLQNVVVEKSKALMVQMIENIEKSAKLKIESTNDGPSSSLFDERTYRPESQSHIGISTQLFKCVKELWASLEIINEKCQQFENICVPMADIATANSLKETMATNVNQLLLRLCEPLSETGDSELCSSTRASRCLSRARLAITIVHSETSLVCLLLDKDSQRISNLNHRLHVVIEQNLRCVSIFDLFPCY